jgi:hypothetical protein
MKLSCCRDGASTLHSTVERDFQVNGIGKQEAFYRGYLPNDDRSLVPLTVLLSSTLALWLLIYVVTAVAEVRQNAPAWYAAPATFIPPPSAAYSLMGHDVSAPR